MKKKETGLTKLAVKIGGLAGRTSSAISRASTALKRTIMPSSGEAEAKGRKATAKRKTARKGAASTARAAAKRASSSRKVGKKARAA
jgi:hypothetical protein